MTICKYVKVILFYLELFYCYELSILPDIALDPLGEAPMSVDYELGNE